MKFQLKYLKALNMVVSFVRSSGQHTLSAAKMTCSFNQISILQKHNSVPIFFTF
jgi:hypothetical protein